MAIASHCRSKDYGLHKFVYFAIHLSLVASMVRASHWSSEVTVSIPASGNRNVVCEISVLDFVVDDNHETMALHLLAGHQHVIGPETDVFWIIGVRERE